MKPTRAVVLADLADAINELTEPRQHAEYLEVTVRGEETVTRSGKRRKAKRTRRRKAHIVTLPSLLTSLADAAVPGSGEAGNAAGGYESRPSAELEPVSVLRQIDDEAGVWARRFQIERPTLAGVLHALVSAPLDDEQLARVESQAARWVKLARLATGFDPAPVTLNQPCPYCLRRHALVITGDLQTARCSRCGVEWTPDTIGLLADMLRTNTTQETAAAVRCVWPDCRGVGPHPVHSDGAGRTWRDSCDVATRGWGLGSADERMGA